MDEYIKNILELHKDIFDESPEVRKVSGDYTNEIYEINDIFILKVCKNQDNESYFTKEIDYYSKNMGNKYIPKMYIGSLIKTRIPYCYEILEKKNSKSLYKVWPFISYFDRKEIIRQLCDYMKTNHSKKGNQVDWCGYLQSSFIQSFNQALHMSLFTAEEIRILKYAYYKFSKYTGIEDTALVHNDLHFNNIFYDNKDITVIDFEKTMYAPIDYEFSTIGRMLDNPQRFINNGEGNNVNPCMLENIMDHIKEFYPEIVSNKYFEQRKSIYNLVSYLKQLIQNPDSKLLHNDVMEAARIIAFKDELEYKDCKTPEDLFNYIDSHIKYGWLDNEQNKHVNYLVKFKGHYISSTIDEILKSGVGTCIEQAKLAKHFLDEHGYENEAFCKVNDVEHASIHCYVIYKDKETNKWNLFEHSRFLSRGITSFDTKEEAERYYPIDSPASIYYKIDKFPDGYSYNQFIDYVLSSKQIDFKQKEKVK